MRALVVIGGAMLIGACSLGALDGFSGAEPPPSSDGGPTNDGPVAPDSSSTVDAPEPTFDAPTTSAYHAAVAADAPVAHFALEETSGASCASSTNTTAVCVYPSGNATRGKPGIGGTKALHFDASTATLSVSGLSGNLSLPYTFELWIRLDSVAAGTGIGWFQDDGDGHPGPGFNLFVWDTGNRLRTELWNSDMNIAYGVAPTAFTANAWHHVVIAHETGPDNDLFYVDAQIVEHYTNTSASRPSAVASPLTFAGFVGSIDEIAVYDKPLSSARIAAHYAAQ